MPIAHLKPYPRNARTHSRKQIKQIANSIRRFGFAHRPAEQHLAPDQCHLFVSASLRRRPMRRRARSHPQSGHQPARASEGCGQSPWHGGFAGRAQWVPTDATMIRGKANRRLAASRPGCPALRRARWG
jgi:hypothetical protein